MLWWLAENTLLAAVLAGLAVLVGRLGRLGPATRHALWLVVLLKLLTPPLLAWPWSPVGGWRLLLATPATSPADDAGVPVPQRIEGPAPVDEVAEVTGEEEAALPLPEVPTV